VTYGLHTYIHTSYAPHNYSIFLEEETESRVLIRLLFSSVDDVTLADHISEIDEITITHTIE